MITAFTAYKDSTGKLYTSVEAVQQAERRALYADLLKGGVANNPQLARLDGELVVDLLMTLGLQIGQIANDRLAPQGIGPGGAVGGAAKPATPAHAALLAAARPVRSVPTADYRPTLEEQEERAKDILRPVRSAPELAMPYGGKPAMAERGFTASLEAEKLTPEEPARKRDENSDSKVESSRPFGIPAEPMANAVDLAGKRAEGMEPATAALREKVWPRHPLDPAPVNTTPVGVKVPVINEDLLADEMEANLRRGN